MFTVFGLLVLTALYIGMVIALHYKSPRDCLLGDAYDAVAGDAEDGYDEDPDSLCQSEGVDNTILNWASDFFVAFWMFIFGLHLSVGTKPNTGVRKTGILAQVFMGAAFAMAGMGNWLYPNSGTDDNHGMVAFWIVQMFMAIFFTASAVSMAHFALSASRDTDPELKQSVCANDRWILPCGVLLLISMSGYLAGSIMCSMGSDTRAHEILDEYDPIDTKESSLQVCVTVTRVSDVLMNLSYALVWLPVGFLLRATAQEEPVLVLGLPTPIAATIAMLTQWTVGSMLLVLIFWMELGSPKLNNFGAWNAIYGTVLYHWAMLISLYCFHNLSFGLPLYYEGEEEGPTPLSWEWWVALVTWAMPEPKEIDSDDEEAMKEADRRDFFEDKSSKRTADSDIEDNISM